MAKNTPAQPLDEEALAALLGTDADEDTSSADFELSEDDLSVLSDVEREAYEEAQDAEEEEEGDDGDGGDDTAAALEAAAAAEEAAKMPEAQTEPDPVIAKALEEQQRATADMERLNGELAQIDQQDAALFTKFSEGEIEDDEYQEQLAELKKTRDTTVRQLGVAEHAANSVQRVTDDAWKAANDAFVQAHPEFISSDHIDGFNQVVGDITENPRFAALPFDRQLAIAAQTYALQAQALGHDLAFDASAAPKPAKAKAANAPDEEGAKPKAEKPKREAPRTLAKIPAETIDPNQSSVAAISTQLDNLGPLEREALMARIPEHLLEQVLNYE